MASSKETPRDEAGNPQSNDNDVGMEDVQNSPVSATKTTSTSTSSGSPDRMVGLQAILARLPMYAILEEGGRNCLCCCCSGCAASRGGCCCVGYPKEIPELPWVRRCNEHVSAGLDLAISEYPQYRSVLSRLEVVHASFDMAMLADHEEKQLFTCFRGTNLWTCRDLGNDAIVLFGGWLCRTKWLREEYLFVRGRYLDYVSYGAGHSLGGTLATELALLLEDQPSMAFRRVDVFNSGGSPFARAYTDLKVTQYNSHRVAQDWVSRYFQAPGNTVEHPLRPEYPAHSMHHFLPEPLEDFFQSAAHMFHRAEEFTVDCCADVGRRIRSGADNLAQGAADAADAIADGAQDLAASIFGSESPRRRRPSASDIGSTEEGDPNKKQSHVSLLLEGESWDDKRMETSGSSKDVPDRQDGKDGQPSLLPKDKHDSKQRHI